ncbi:MAG TPA: PqqD family peptide modification chaperone [Caulobacteraceae bacterium]|nr:PqqD family peptide modification chaperone [Caulobacteraceae bacterium]
MPARPALTVDDRVVQNPDVVVAESDGELVLLSLERGRCYGMNRVGMSIWRRLQQPRKVADVLGEVIAEFDAPAAQAEPEAMAFLEQLQREGLIAQG